MQLLVRGSQTLDGPQRHVPQICMSRRNMQVVESMILMQWSLILTLDEPRPKNTCLDWKEFGMYARIALLMRNCGIVNYLSI